MHTSSLHDDKDEMAQSGEEKFIEVAESASILASEKAMTRRIVLNLDFRYV